MPDLEITNINYCELRTDWQKMFDAAIDKDLEERILKLLAKNIDKEHLVVVSSNKYERKLALT